MTSESITRRIFGHEYTEINRFIRSKITHVISICLLGAHAHDQVVPASLYSIQISGMYIVESLSKSAANSRKSFFDVSICVRLNII